MSIHHLHIHIICDSKDASVHPILDAITLYLEPYVYLTKDLFVTGVDSANYSWRCVNDCHYALMVLGQSYGELSNTGVSQLHVSYLNARTKHKPIIAFVTDDSDRPRQLHDLIALVGTHAQQMHHITEKTHLPTLLEYVKPMLNCSTDDLPKESVLTQSKSNQSLSSTALIHYEPSMPKTTPHLQDEVILNCTAHAFQGGTLIEVAFLAYTTWQAILAYLDVNLAFTSQGLWRMLNELITPQAMPAIKNTHPAVHAISRCQVAKADMLVVEKTLHISGWITQTATSTTVKPTWRMSDSAKKSLTHLTTKKESI